MRGTRKKDPRPVAEIKKDSQQQAVYSWEEDWRDWCINSITYRQCRHVIRDACKLFGVKAPSIQFHKGRTWSWQQEDVISLQDNGKPNGCIGQLNSVTCLHEVAHYIHWRRGGAGQDHGSTWLGIYMHLLRKFSVAPTLALWATANSHGLRWTECKR